MIDGNCSELLYSACVIVEAQLRVQDVKDIVCAHPTISEIIKDAIESLKI
jgi:dihydrolipoamide dehydrogenase